MSCLLRRCTARIFTAALLSVLQLPSMSVDLAMISAWMRRRCYRRARNGRLDVWGRGEQQLPHAVVRLTLIEFKSLNLE
jgi:hypothetical protein